MLVRVFKASRHLLAAVLHAVLHLVTEEAKAIVKPRSLDPERYS